MCVGRAVRQRHFRTAAQGKAGGTQRELEDKIDSLQKGLGQATKNHLYEAMSAFKAMSE